MTDLKVIPGRIPLPIRNGPAKIQLNRISHVYHSHPDLDAFDTFAKDFGFIEDSRDEKSQTIYYRGYGRDKCVYVASKSHDGGRHFGGVAFIAQTEEDFLRASKLAAATTPVKEYTGPGGGKIVTVESPSGTKVHVLWGVEERPVPSKADTQTEVHKGVYNTALQKSRKGEFQRFKLGPAMIHKLGHVGYVTTLFDEDMAFYTQTFNFVPSDVLYEDNAATGAQTDALTFMHLDHGKDYVDHHTIFLSRAPLDFKEKQKMHHCSFEVEDFDTQLLGHEYLLSKKWTPIWGVGRHILGSQIFDYWKDPSGFAIEHYADGDLVNEDNETGREKSEGAASMYIWGPLRPEAGVA